MPIVVEFITYRFANMIIIIENFLANAIAILGEQKWSLFDAMKDTYPHKVHLN